MKHHQNFILITATTLALLASCGGGSDTQATINDPANAATPAGGTTTLVTTTCAPAPELPSKYSRVFKGCDSAGVALCGAQERAAPAAGAKRKGHLRFPFLFELLPFPCFLIWRRFPICDRFENRERQRIFSTVGEHSVLPCRNLYAVPDIVLLHMWVSLRRRGIAVPRNS